MANIYEKMHEIYKAVQRLSKDDNVSFGQTKYKALSEAKVTGIMREQFNKQKLVVWPIEQNWTRIGNITHVDVKYRILNVENPDEYIDVVSCGDGADTQDKGSGKAMTYAYKYMWLRTFAIQTGEDPDKICNEELEYMQEKEEIKMMQDSGINANEWSALQRAANKAGEDPMEIIGKYGAKKASEMKWADWKKEMDRLNG
jgi:hypothetical protein